MFFCLIHSNHFTHLHLIEAISQFLEPPACSITSRQLKDLHSRGDGSKHRGHPPSLGAVTISEAVEGGWACVHPADTLPSTPSKDECTKQQRTPQSASSSASDSSWERLSQVSSPAEYREAYSSVKTEMKYVLVSGGVVSGIGKGLTASSLGVLFKSCGWRCTSIKIDPYVNCDAGTMSPFEHGEVYVLNDGGEVDLDLGNYERFLDVELCRDNNITTGKIFKHVIEKERRGEYDGKAVQMVPHLTDAVQEWVEEVARRPTDPSGEEPDVCIIELGGTVGDIENMPFIEALRQMMIRIGDENFCNCYVSLIPVIGVVGEQKTKPTQHGVKELRSLGMQPDILFCRGSEPMQESTQAKLSMHCHVDKDAVISVHDVSNVYRIPLLMHEQGVTNLLIKKLHLVWKLPERLPMWKQLADRMDACVDPVHIALVGKYTGLSDAYLSVIKGLLHGAIAVNRKLVIDWVAAEELEVPKRESDPEKSKAAWDVIQKADGLLVPGGFGVRGVDGKVEVCKYARENKKPILGICLGFQSMTIEAARNLWFVTTRLRQSIATADCDFAWPICLCVDGRFVRWVVRWTLSPLARVQRLGKCQLHGI
eukprot:COSAG01_NODE_3033_length_6694_cov_2.154056_2_plen_595_part_00